MQPAIQRFVVTVAIFLAIMMVGAGAFVYSGVYGIGADDPHSRPVFSLLQILRERSIAAHSSGIRVPDLEDPGLILKGAGQYAAMCVQCHLTPGIRHAEIRAGLYPQPPDLTRRRVDPRQAFWVIKHGIKMSAMPAWGGSHDDATIWSMVAFLQKLPDLSPKQYRDIVAKAPPDDDMDSDGGGDHDHDHGGGADQNHDADDMPGMAMPARATSAKSPVGEPRHRGG